MLINPRRLRALGSDAPNVESSLDDFISRANEEPAEVAAPTATASTAVREQELRAKVAQLEQRLAAIKAKRTQSQGWGKLVIGFVLGCGAMFAVSALMPRDEGAPSTATPAPVAVPAVAPPPAKIEITPIEEAPAPVAAEPAAPVAVEPPAQVAPVETPARVEPAAKPAKKVRREKPQPAPSADKRSGTDLYNPF